MNSTSKKEILENLKIDFCNENNVNVNLKFSEKFSIKKKSNFFELTLEQKDVETLDIDSLKWYLYSNLDLIVNGRFPKLKTQLLLALVPLFYFSFLCIVFDLLKFFPSDSITLKSFSIVFLSMYLVMSAWSRNKIFKADKSASEKMTKDSGIHFLMTKMGNHKEIDLLSKDSSIFYFLFLLSSHPSYYQRALRLSK